MPRARAPKTPSRAVSGRRVKAPLSAEEEALTAQFDSLVQKLTLASKGRQKHIAEQQKQSRNNDSEIARRVADNRARLEALETSLAKCRLAERELEEKLLKEPEPPWGEGAGAELDPEDSRRFLQGLEAGE